MAGLLFLALAYFAVGQATVTRNEAQGAADAAALAAAHDARAQLGTELVSRLSEPDTPDMWDLLEGRTYNEAAACAEAERFAAMNHADARSCTGSYGTRQAFTVEVKTRRAVGKSVIPGTETQHAVAIATAVIEPLCTAASPAPGSDDGEGDGDGDGAASIELVCEGEEMLVDPESIDSVPGVDSLFAVRLID
ncbi:pilus assembly protein TadG-related protein [Streptomyces sp. TRM 70351]|uniref:pilus assembly protein TadG-related protein n=1 Tax=Streptomyces sp. TRM 70351 TaxID=3116552 RepID=UPI002E7B9778|nr:pilus assembly protein TadG-related protein [Streptomyces sp. TRM 70351]MEE1927802.1 pilus assembly protein TadG-related protein [Streptomyces sp. TRM 70351]